MLFVDWFGYMFSKQREDFFTQMFTKLVGPLFVQFQIWAANPEHVLPPFVFQHLVDFLIRGLVLFLDVWEK